MFHDVSLESPGTPTQKEITATLTTIYILL